jgi:hypothetical protein
MGAVERLEVLEVEPGREGSTGAAHHDHLDVGRVVEPPADRDQLAEQLPGECVQSVRAVE